MSMLMLTITQTITKHMLSLICFVNETLKENLKIKVKLKGLP